MEYMGRIMRNSYVLRVVHHGQIIRKFMRKSFCRFHQVLFGRPYVCTMDGLPSLVTKGLVLFPKYNVLVILFLRFPGRGQVMDAVTVDNHLVRTSLT